MIMEELTKAVIVDLTHGDLQKQDLVKSLDNPNYSNCSVICLSHKDLSEELRASNLNTKEIQNIVEKDKYSVFYSAKKFLDLKGIKDITILCLNDDEDFWNAVGDVLFTPVHKWKVNLGDNTTGDREKFKADVLNKMSKLLQDLPSEGSIETFHSKLIPDDIFYHGFTSRNGGVSYMPGMKSLNLVYTNTKIDPRVVVKENRSRLASHAGFNEEYLHTAQTVHGKDVHVIGNEIKDGGYDGVVTNKSGITVAAPGADCVTVLFADPIQRACGAAHAGWKGTLAGITSEVIKSMETNFRSKPEDILIVMGPSIGSCCFEFGKEESKHFSDIDPSCVVWRDGEPQPFIDLHKVNRILLERKGIQPQHIDDTSQTKCTSCNPGLFFSYRRDGRPFGNQIGFIGIK